MTMTQPARPHICKKMNRGLFWAIMLTGYGGPANLSCVHFSLFVRVPVVTSVHTQRHGLIWIHHDFLGKCCCCSWFSSAKASWPILARVPGSWNFTKKLPTSVQTQRHGLIWIHHDFLGKCCCCSWFSSAKASWPILARVPDSWNFTKKLVTEIADALAIKLCYVW